MRRLCSHVLSGLCLIVLVIAGPGVVQAQAAAPEQSEGQTVYVPVYSQVFFGDKARTFDLSATLNIRNIDVRGAIQVTKVGYYNENGKHVRDFVDKPVVLQPWTSTRFFIKESDNTGGANAFFIVIWQADSPVLPPIIESVMIGAMGQQGVSFLTRGTAIDEIE
jgi:hypothetical protein